jgi:hypothetical protein
LHGYIYGVDYSALAGLHSRMMLANCMLLLLSTIGHFVDVNLRMNPFLPNLSIV